MIGYLEGCDVLGADASSGSGTVNVYTDADTVRAVQQWLANVGGGKAFTGRDGKPLKVDGVVGPDTNAAVRKFNTSYRGVPGDGDFITDGTLSSMAIEASATPATVILKPSTPAPSLPSGGRPAKGWSQPQPDAMGPAITPEQPGASMPPWKIGLTVGLGATALVAVIGGIALALRRKR